MNRSKKPSTCAECRLPIADARDRLYRNGSPVHVACFATDPLAAPPVLYAEDADDEPFTLDDFTKPVPLATAPDGEPAAPSAQALPPPAAAPAPPPKLPAQAVSPPRTPEANPPSLDRH